tara:strand:- start:168 stop:338 length:171 start_codon:yes stop_codon:yes gene_type:complete
MKEIIIEILKRWGEADVNLQSEAAREGLAKELTYELLKDLRLELSGHKKRKRDIYG